MGCPFGAARDFATPFETGPNIPPDNKGAEEALILLTIADRAEQTQVQGYTGIVEFGKDFLICDSISSKNETMRSFGAMILSLNEAKWTVDRMDIQFLSIETTTCLRDNPTHCLKSSFTTNKAGVIHAQAVNYEDNLLDDATRWLTILEQVYSKYRCYTDETIWPAK